MTTSKFNQWDIVLVPFPFTDLTSIKKRPAFVLSGNSYNAKGNDYILCGITSQPFRGIGHGDFVLTNLNDTGLLKPSVIRVGRIGTFHESTIVKKIGVINKEVRYEIQGNLLNIFEMDIAFFM